MYWHDIGTSVAQVFVNTFEQNLIYGRPILPLGQTYGGVSATELVDFRSLASAYGAAGDSFWDWQESSATDWSLAGGAAEHDPHGPPAGADLAAAQRRHQERSGAVAAGAPRDRRPGPADDGHLRSDDEGQPRAVPDRARASRRAAKRTPDTWAALLALAPVPVNWTGSGPPT